MRTYAHPGKAHSRTPPKNLGGVLSAVQKEFYILFIISGGRGVSTTIAPLGGREGDLAAHLLPFVRGVGGASRRPLIAKQKRLSVSRVDGPIAAAPIAKLWWVRFCRYPHFREAVCWLRLNFG